MSLKDADIPDEAKLEVFAEVLDRYDTTDMSPEEECQVIEDNMGSIKRMLRDRGFAMELDSAEMDKSADKPTDMLAKSIYDGTEGRGTTSVDSELASDIEERWSVKDVDTVDPDESASLGIFYGERGVETAASSNRGDSYHESGNQAE